MQTSEDDPFDIDLSGVYLHVQRHGRPSIVEGYVVSEYIVTRRGQTRRDGTPLPDARLAWFDGTVGLHWWMRGAPETAKLVIDAEVQSDLDELKDQVGDRLF